MPPIQKCRHCNAEVHHIQIHESEFHNSCEITYYGELHWHVSCLLLTGGHVLGDRRTIHRPSECSNLICICEKEFRMARQARKHAKMEHISEIFGTQKAVCGTGVKTRSGRSEESINILTSTLLKENNVRLITFRFVKMDEINAIGPTGCRQVGIRCRLERDVG